MVTIDSKSITSDEGFIKYGDIYFGESEYTNHSAMAYLMPMFKKLGFETVTAHRLPNGEASQRTNGMHIHPCYALQWDSFSNSYVKINTGGRLYGSQRDGRDIFRYIRSSFSNENFASLTKDLSDKKGFAIFDEYSDMLGYYNAIQNALFLCDVTHNHCGIAYVEDVLAVVEEFKIFHKIDVCDFDTDYLPPIENDILLGLDPEVLLRIGNKSIDVPDKFSSSTAQVGSDGSYIELRPSPGNVKELTDNVTALYKILSDGIGEDVSVFAGGGYGANAAMGGHIHFNIPNQKQFITMLDDFIGRPLKLTNGSSRRGSSYGALAATEDKEYGFEYRTPPSFIGKPDFFVGVLAVAYCLAQTWKMICNEQDTFKYEAGDVTGAMSEEYAKLVGYEEHAEAIETFLSYIANPHKTMEEPDVLAAWKIRKPIKDIVI